MIDKFTYESEEELLSFDSIDAYRVWMNASKKQSLVDLLKASFGGDRSAAGRYAAQQRWKGHVKDATKPATRGRRMAEKFQEGPILKNGYDNFGFPKLLTPDEAKKRFGDTVLKQMAYFQGRGLELYVSDKNFNSYLHDGVAKFDTESPAYFAVLQALDDVMDQVDTTKLYADPKNGLFPNVRIDDYFSNSGDTTGGYFESTKNKVALFMNTAQLIEKGYTDGRPFQISTVPQVAADAIQGLHGGDSISARIAYGFTVHEMGHWVDDALGNQSDGPPKGFWSNTLTDRVRKDPAKASDDEISFALGYYDFFGPGDKGSQYSNTAPVERFAENFTAWFTLTKVNEFAPNELKRSLAAQGGFLAVEAALEVLKQGRIVDNVLNWRPDHPVFLFAFRGEPFDVDAFRQQLLVGMIKASFGGDRSAAGKYAAEQRWKNHQKKEEDKKGRSNKSPLAQSIIEANESLKKAGITVRVIEMDNSGSEEMQQLSEKLRIKIEKSAKIISKSKNFAPLTQERWFFEAVNLMKASVKVQDDNLMPRKVFIVVAEKGNAIIGAMRYVPDSFKEEAKHLQEGEIPSAGSLRVVKGVGTAMFGEAIKIAARTGSGKIKIEALNTAESFWKSQGFKRVKNAKLKENSTYDMTIDADAVQALDKEISS